MENQSTFDDMISQVSQGAPIPKLPAFRTFVVRRLNPLYNTDTKLIFHLAAFVEQVYVTAHFAEYGQGGTLILLAYVVDEEIHSVVTRTVRAFSSWLDCEVVPTPSRSALAH